MLMAPCLAFLCPLFLFIGKATFFANIEDLPVFLHFLDHSFAPDIIFYSSTNQILQGLELSLNYCIMNQENISRAGKVVNSR